MICYCEKKKKIVSVKRAMKKCVKTNILKRGVVCHYLKLKGGRDEQSKSNHFSKVCGVLKSQKTKGMDLFD